MDSRLDLSCQCNQLQAYARSSAHTLSVVAAPILAQDSSRSAKMPQLTVGVTAGRWASATRVQGSVTRSFGIMFCSQSVSVAPTLRGSLFPATPRRQISKRTHRSPVELAATTPSTYRSPTAIVRRVASVGGKAAGFGRGRRREVGVGLGFTADPLSFHVGAGKSLATTALLGARRVGIRWGRSRQRAINCSVASRPRPASTGSSEIRSVLREPLRCRSR
jgi:hypothetical protein